MSFRSLIADLVLGGNLANAYNLTGTITLGDPTRGHLVINGATQAILLYTSPTTLAVSIAPTGGIDPNGIHYPSGVAFFDPTNHAQIAVWDEFAGFSISNTAGVSSTGQTLALTAAPANFNSGGAVPAGTNPAFVRAFFGYLLAGMDALVVSSPISRPPIDTDNSSIALALSQGNAVDGALAQFQFLATSITAVLAQIDKTGFNIKAGAVTAPQPGGTIGQSETWHTATVVNANWTNTGAAQPLRYRREGIAGGIVRLSGELLTTGVGPWPASTTLVSLGANYAPLQGTPFITRSDIAVAAGNDTVNVLNTGNIQNGQAFTAAGQRLFFDGITYPVD
ncbi:MAG TPA: hypothetical protein VGS97_26135 [Actinocrinis sp.]|uniref:hypothetical protein n=1 Tax=Actinocrinis sp. TaxID=1920516 RepID=UPI002DDCD6C8|nr:hypothetical protein [Actinocrinis sp.]HEV2347598.1 hypothetical protein [Actinocrinis sp.]